eukprot:evm.model.NODE_34240_length_32379_cov_28.507706.5
MLLLRRRLAIPLLTVASSLHRSFASTAAAAAGAPTTTSSIPRCVIQIDLAEGAVDTIGAKHRQIIGPRTLVVSTPGDRAEDPHVQRVLARLRGVGIQCGTFSMQERYPTTQAVDEGVVIAKRMGAQSVIGVGGGGVLDLAKGVAALACARSGVARDYLRVFHKEKELSTQRLAIVTVPTTASAGGGSVGHRSFVLYEPEEALAPFHAADLTPDVAVIDPTLTSTLPPQAERAMALSALSVYFDALACGSARATLEKNGMAGLLIAGATELGAGMRMAGGGKTEDKEQEKRRRMHLAQGSVTAGQLLGLVEAPPIQSLARCLAPLFPLASYSQLTAVLLRSYLAVLADRQQQGDVGGLDVFNEALLQQIGGVICGDSGGGALGLLELAEWVWGQSQQAGIRSLADYRVLDKEEKTGEALTAQVTSVLDLFQVEGGVALETDVVRDVIDVSLGS